MVKNRTGLEAGAFLKIVVLPAWERTFGVVWLDTSGHPLGGGRSTSRSFLIGFRMRFIYFLEVFLIISAKGGTSRRKPEKQFMQFMVF